MRHPSIKVKTVIIVILLIIFLIILNLTNLSSVVKNFFYLISAPIQRTFWLAGDGITDFFETIFKARDLQEKNEKLELKIQEMSAKIASLKETEKENRILREAIDIDLQKEFDIILAQITGKDIARDSILINKGSEDGILKDRAVITQEKILLGKISDVYKNFSRIMLVSSVESVIPVNIQKQEVDKLINVEALIRGRGNFQIELDHIPIGEEIKDGYRVVTSALGGIFPPGILIGYVKNIERLGAGLFQRAEVQSAVDIRDINHLFIVTDF